MPAALIDTRFPEFVKVRPGTEGWADFTSIGPKATALSCVLEWLKTRADASDIEHLMGELPGLLTAAKSRQKGRAG